MLNRQRREQAAVRQGGQGAAKRVVRERFGVDEDVCTGDHACIRLSGCPSLSVKQLDDPLQDDPVAAIDNTCVGCGNCGEVADAAVLCPSFYRADIVHNPTRLRAVRWQGCARGMIGFLQRRRAGAASRWSEASAMNIDATPSSIDRAGRSHRHPGHGRPGRRRAGRLDRGAGGSAAAGSRNRPRCRASPSAPARRSITSR